MRAEFKNDALVVVPESEDEVKDFNRLFPEHFMKNSRHINVRQFVDMFGNPESNRPYILVSGYDPTAEVTVRKPRKLKDTGTQTAAV
jgi:hypothetical protein